MGEETTNTSQTTEGTQEASAPPQAETTTSPNSGTAIPPPIAPPNKAATPGHHGKRYSFLCSYCSSRLEAVESMAGQGGSCPTCGNTIVIPILDARGRLIDPTSGQVIKQDPHPVHAYAAAGHKAPQIVPTDTGENHIECPRCGRRNTLAANNCLGCGLPFTMEGTTGDVVSGTNTWAVASLILGIVSICCGFFFIIPPILAVLFGFLGMRSSTEAAGQPRGQALAITGLILGTIGFVVGGIVWIHILHR